MNSLNFSTDKSHLTPDEVIDLLVAIGWGDRASYHPVTVARSLASYPLIVTARDQQNKLVAYATAFSDLAFTTVMGELIVHPAYRQRGVGRHILQITEAHFPGTHFYIKTFQENIAFFERCGFTQRPNMVVLSKSTKSQ